MKTEMPRALAMMMLFVLGVGSGCGGTPGSRVDTALPGESAWPRLTEELSGDWVATTPSGRELVVGYRPTSRGSALVESWAPGTGAETISVYHPDEESLQVTHYCGQGNQAVLRLTSADEHRVEFERVAVTNLLEGRSVLTRLVLSWVQPGVLVRTEVYESQDGSLETTELRFATLEGAERQGDVR